MIDSNTMFEPFTRARREFLARTIMDVLKFVVAAGLASGFFEAYPLKARIILAVLIFTLFGGSWIMFPANGAAKP